MCIVLLTTSHPKYALVAIDNRDEFILRPTSRPHWWTHPETGVRVLSSRDLQRAEKGTWLGITEDGVFAVLTNYRETVTDDAAHPIHARRSRGGMVTAWLGSDPRAKVADTVHHLVKEGGVKGVGGFSMVAGKLRKRELASNGSGTHDGFEDESNALEPIAIISNRCDDLHDVPWIAERRGEVYGLSNTSYNDPNQWPKVVSGKQLLSDVIAEAAAKDFDEEELTEHLFRILDTDSLPPAEAGMSFADYIPKLRLSIHIPPIGDDLHRTAMEAAHGRGGGEWDSDDKEAAESLERPEASQGTENVGFETGMYGTQRQTVILVDWEGNVSFRERALWDSNGNAIERSKGDVSHHFKIKSWTD